MWILDLTQEKSTKIKGILLLNMVYKWTEDVVSNYLCVSHMRQ